MALFIPGVIILHFEHFLFNLVGDVAQLMPSVSN